MSKHRLILLARQGLSTSVLYNSLKDEFDIEAIILEKPVSMKEFLKKRIKTLGIWKVVGQILFQLLVAKFLNLASSKRKKEILEKYGLKDTPLPAEKVIGVPSVNSAECISLLQKIKPELVIVNGTRIISKEILKAVPVKFVNIHAGITPKYRNVHGGYWAIVNNDIENCGVTVHLVDEGIDTGNIIYQQKITITPKDNFATYPVLQLAEGIIYLKKAIKDIFNNSMALKQNNLESKLWYHPTIWQYIYYRLVHNKK
ncbi:MAG TPA: formyl transferase [Hanamia sp.]|nr:formyl transferase [Hanamia sp.]